MVVSPQNWKFSKRNTKQQKLTNMAPNQKRTPIQLTAVDLDLVQTAKATFPPLTSKVPSRTHESKAIHVPDSTDYWGWSSENDAEINKLIQEECLSVDHIVNNILRQPAVRHSAETCASNDKYWGWSHANNESTDYWNWPATSDEQLTSSINNIEDNDSYWEW